MHAASHDHHKSGEAGPRWASIIRLLGEVPVVVARAR